MTLGKGLLILIVMYFQQHAIVKKTHAFQTLNITSIYVLTISKIYLKSTHGLSPFIYINSASDWPGVTSLFTSGFYVKITTPGSK